MPVEPAALPLVFEVLRADDLLSLRIEAHNLKLDTSKGPRLVVRDAKHPAYLVIDFQAQTITEKAYFETGTIPTVPPQGDDALDPAGNVASVMGGSSRLVFRLPSKVKEIPFTISGLLDWSQLDLVISPTARGEQKPPPILPPGELETAIEMPYRLILSPAGAVAWAHARDVVTRAGRAELWHTMIGTKRTVKSKQGSTTTFEEASERSPVALRAIWSPDFQDHAPLTGPGAYVPFTTAMSPGDRERIVILTSGVSGYFVVDAAGRATPWVPQPIHATRLFLSTLGGWLTSRGSWDPLPSFKADDGSTQTVDLTEWRHIATQGRDHYVRIVYEGFLYPFGHRATLVKVTERKFVPPDGTTVTSPTAYLRQHMYIVVREREKTYPPASYPFNGREMPFWQSVRINSIVTPDIEKPVFIVDGLINTSSFWIRVPLTGDFPFHLTATDLAGVEVDFQAPLIFVDVNEQNMNTVGQVYRSSGARRLCSVPGRKIAYADPAAGDTILKTSGLNFDAAILQPSPPYAVVPFRPFLDDAVVTVPALEHLLGTSGPVAVRLYGGFVGGDPHAGGFGYLGLGLDSNAGVFSQIEVPPEIRFSADKGGGLATPNIVLTALSARKGLVAGDPADAAAGLIDPAKFFGGVSIPGKLFGTVPLSDLIPLGKIAGSPGKADAAKNAPEIRTRHLPDAHNPTSIVTQVQWSPDLHDYSASGVTITFNEGGTSALTLTAKSERQLQGGPPTSEVKGELNHFKVSLLQIVDVSVDSLKFSSQNGQKSIVVAQLPTSNPVAFAGPLAFVQKLAEILPPGVFGGSGPSIELKPTGIRVTYTIGLPTIAVGVFSLEHISFMAGMDLPYVDGKPAFEFAFASRHSPFLLTVECIGGGGFVHLVIDTEGVQMVEGALEFGGHLSFDVGVASGGVHIMAGIYFQLKSNFTELQGFVDIGGEVSILGIISISIELNLSLTYQESKGKKTVTGKATLKVSIHIIFFSISVSVSVEKSFGDNPGDPRAADVLTAGDWAEYAAAFA